MSEIKVYLNGDLTPCPSGLTLPEFLGQQQFNPRLVAVEYNGEIIHRQYWPETIIKRNDRLEVVTIVGGG